MERWITININNLYKHVSVKPRKFFLPNFRRSWTSKILIRPYHVKKRQFLSKRSFTGKIGGLVERTVHMCREWTTVLFSYYFYFICNRSNCIKFYKCRYLKTKKYNSTCLQFFSLCTSPVLRKLSKLTFFLGLQDNVILKQDLLVTKFVNTITNLGETQKK